MNKTYKFTMKRIRKSKKGIRHIDGYNMTGDGYYVVYYDSFSEFVRKMNLNTQLFCGVKKYDEKQGDYVPVSKEVERILYRKIFAFHRKYNDRFISPVY